MIVVGFCNLDLIKPFLQKIGYWCILKFRSGLKLVIHVRGDVGCILQQGDPIEECSVIDEGVNSLAFGIGWCAGVHTWVTRNNFRNLSWKDRFYLGKLFKYNMPPLFLVML